MKTNGKFLIGDFELSSIDSNQLVISNYFGSESEIVLPSFFGDMPIVAIGQEAFLGNKFLKKVTIPSGFESIMTWAFRDCINLKEAVLPEGLKRIFPYAFENCETLERIVFPSSLTKIGHGSFMGCISIKKIVIPKNVNYIEENPFVGCLSLEDISVDDNNPNFISYGNCIIESKTKTIRIGCKKSIIPNYINSIGEKAFAEHNEINQILIPENVKRIEYQSFYECNLKRIFAFEKNVDIIKEHFKYQPTIPTIYLFAKAETDFLKPGHWWKYILKDGKIIGKFIKEIE